MYQLTKGYARESGVVNSITGRDHGTVLLWGGWSWTHDGREYKTNGQGEGLFLRVSDGTWSQCQGTGQFSLPEDRQTTLRRLRRQGLAPDLEV